MIKASRSKKSAELVAQALEAKQRYVTLDLVIPDGDLKTHVERYGPEGERLLTLGAVLLFDGFGGLASQILRSLEANLAHFRPRLDEKKSKHLADNLLNGRDQFLNTLSELGLARRLSMQGRTIDLAQPFHDVMAAGTLMLEIQPGAQSGLSRSSTLRPKRQALTDSHRPCRRKFSDS